MASLSSNGIHAEAVERLVLPERTPGQMVPTHGFQQPADVRASGQQRDPFQPPLQGTVPEQLSQQDATQGLQIRHQEVLLHRVATCRMT